MLPSLLSTCSLIICSHAKTGCTLDLLWKELSPYGHELDDHMKRYIWRELRHRPELNAFETHEVAGAAVGRRPRARSSAAKSKRESTRLLYPIPRSEWESVDPIEKGSVVTLVGTNEMITHLTEEDKCPTIPPVARKILQCICASRERGIRKEELVVLMGIDSKDFYRHVKFLVDRNLVVKTYSFSERIRPTKLLPPALVKSFHSRRFSPIPLPVRKANDDCELPQEKDAVDVERIDREVIPKLILLLRDSPSPEVLETDLLKRATDANVLLRFPWPIVRIRLVLSDKVEWVHLHRDNDFHEGFRLLSRLELQDTMPAPSAQPSYLADGVPGIVLALPLQFHMYRLIDAAGTKGILQISLLSRLGVPLKYGRRALRSLRDSLPTDHIKSVPDRCGTTVAYRLYLKKYESTSRQEASKSLRSKPRRLEDSYTKSRTASAGLQDLCFLQRSMWVRDIVKVRRVIKQDTLLRLLRRRDPDDQNMDKRSLLRILEPLIKEGAVAVREVHPMAGLHSVVNMVFDGSMNPDTSEAREEASEAALRYDAYLEEMLELERDQRRGRPQSQPLALPVLYGFIRARLVRCKLLHLHIMKLTLTRAHVSPHWQLWDVLTALPLWLYLSIAGVVENLPISTLHNPELLRLPLCMQARPARELMLSSLVSPKAQQSERVQDTVELLQRLGIIRLFAPSSKLGTWQITVLPSCALWPGSNEFTSAASVHAFWCSMRQQCRAILSRLDSSSDTRRHLNHRSRRMPNALPDSEDEYRDEESQEDEDDADEAIDVDRSEHILSMMSAPSTGVTDESVAFMRAFDPYRFPEVYMAVSWIVNLDVQPHHRERLLRFAEANLVRNDGDVAKASREANVSVLKTAWFFAKRNMPTVRYLAEFERVHEPLQRSTELSEMVAVPPEEVQSRLLTPPPLTGEQQEQEQEQLDVELADERKQREHESVHKRRRRRSHFRSYFCFRGRVDAKHPQEDEDEEEEEEEQDADAAKDTQELDTTPADEQQQQQEQEQELEEEQGREQIESSVVMATKRRRPPSPRSRHEAALKRMKETLAQARSDNADGPGVATIAAAAAAAANPVEMNGDAVDVAVAVSAAAEEDAGADAADVEPWSEAQQDAARLLHDIRRWSAVPSDAELAIACSQSTMPRLHALIAAMKLMLSQPDETYDPAQGVQLMLPFSDAEIEIAFRLLRQVSLIVKHAKGNRSKRGYYAISATASAFSRNPLFALTLRYDISAARRRLKPSLDLYTPAPALLPTCSELLGGLAAVYFPLLATDEIVFESASKPENVSVLGASPINEVVDALEAVIGGERLPELDLWHSTDATHAPTQLRPDEALCCKIEEQVRAAGEGGVDFGAIAACQPADRMEIADALLHLQNHARILKVDVFAQSHYVIDPGAADSIWTLPNSSYVSGDEMSDSPVSESKVRVSSWRLLNGSINVEMVNNVRWALLSAITDAVCMDELSLAKLAPTLSPVELRHMLYLLLLEGRVHCRLVANARGKSERMYFATLHSLTFADNEDDATIEDGPL